MNELVVAFLRACARCLLAEKGTNHFVRVAAYEVACGRNEWPGARVWRADDGEQVDRRSRLS
jgi:hypothetical protein